MSWVAALVKSGSEFDFGNEVARSGEVFVPTYEYLTKPRRKHTAVRVRRVLISGLAFVRANDNADYRYLADNPSFKRLMAHDGRICHISERQMTEFRENCEAVVAEALEARKQRFVKGEKHGVRVGPMAGMEAIVVDGKTGKDGRIRVEVAGRPVKIPVEFL